MKKNDNTDVMSAKDFADEGISASLTSNDLVEVIAHEIYDRFYNMVSEQLKHTKLLEEKYKNLFNVQEEAMRKNLIEANYLSADEKVSFSTDKVGYWCGSMCIFGLCISEELKGSIVKKNETRSYVNFPTEKDGAPKVKIKLTAAEHESEKNIKLKDIEGTITIDTKKQFEKIIKVTAASYKPLLEEIKAHNQRVNEIIEFLPKNGVLSVDRFTREARVKMNKKMLAAKSGEFKEKMATIFEISL